jgi:hypothetical protein
MNQIGPMRVGERRRYQRLFSFSSAMFVSFYKIVYPRFDDFLSNILMISELDSKTLFLGCYPRMP